MSLKNYLKDKAVNIVLYLILFLISAVFLFIFKVNLLLRLNILSFIIIVPIISFTYDYLRRKRFYDRMYKNLNKLDKKYLISEFLGNVNFIEGEIFKDVIYTVDKSMLESINKYKRKSDDLEDYIELWCHEIKTPIATSKMIIENNRNEVTDSIDDELNKIDNLVEQVLYYARSKNVEKDYIIQKVNLEDVVKRAVLRNKKDFIQKKISLKMDELDVTVNSDVKWLEFIINQIVINSIKYSKKQNAKIWIYTIKKKDCIKLCIEDNGIGIKQSDISKVFDKGFTGENGRKMYKSTGMGLYICKTLCDSLYHKIDVLSQENAKTIVVLTFPISSYTNIID
ncbi:sensor histidine kinase [Anaerofustis sp.]|uniref:sensor histidine kinase n=1 Tax=Anaerofustis sp. TaxID=1872517 RepID=UPI0025C63735|nr:sensor histidine kinase [Anaerofustis sp.]